MLLEPGREVGECAGLVVVARPVRPPASGARHEALPHVEIVDLAVRLEPRPHLAEVVQAQTVVLEIVVETHAENAIANRRAHDVHYLVEKGHPLGEGGAPVRVVALIRRCGKEVCEQVVHSDRKLDAVQIAFDRTSRRNCELRHRLLDLVGRHCMGDELRHREIGRRHRGGSPIGPAEKRRSVRHSPPPVAELGEQRHVGTHGWQPPWPGIEE